MPETMQSIDSGVPSIAIIGCGAVGLSFATLLSCPVRGFVRVGGPHIDVEVENPEKSSTQSRRIPVEEMRVAQRRRGWGGEIVVICTKAGAVKEVLSALSSCEVQPELVVLASNGIGLYQVGVEQLPCVPIVRCAVLFGARCMEGDVSPVRRLVLSGSPTVAVSSVPSIHAKKTAEIFRHAGIHVDISPDPTQLEWRKGLINCVVNSVASYFAVSNGEILSGEIVDTFTRPAFLEAVEVARLEGIDVSDLTWTWFCETVAHFASNRNSTLVDIENSRETELSFFLGVIVERAMKRGVSIPTLATLNIWASGL
jgi:2-dehydropantoate 2-reductase